MAVPGKPAVGVKVMVPSHVCRGCSSRGGWATTATGPEARVLPGARSLARTLMIIGVFKVRAASLRATGGSAGSALGVRTVTFCESDPPAVEVTVTDAGGALVRTASVPAVKVPEAGGGQSGRGKGIAGNGIDGQGLAAQGFDIIIGGGNGHQIRQSDGWGRGQAHYSGCCRNRRR